MGNDMEYVKGFNFATFAPRGTFRKKETYNSLEKLIMTTNANYIFFVPNGLQDTPQSTTIDYQSDATVSDEELVEMIKFAKGLGMHVALKPTVNCKNGIWRAYISFFEKDVVCEPKWSEWFEAYTEFQLHYAKMADELDCEMFIAGCEMVMAEHRETQWRELIQKIRSAYRGTVAYNADKYQEDNVKWWDAVDVIASSGYYPLHGWSKELDRIEMLVAQYGKPFFFSEAGCMSTTGSSQIPNNWALKDRPNVEEQAVWYEDMLSECDKREWVRGFSFWSWPARLAQSQQVEFDSGYDVYGKPACDIISKYFASK